jgi:2'-5' RNA ligase
VDDALQAQYDAIWAQGQAAFAAGAPALDAQLLDKAGDRRRSATLLIRPSPAVAARVAAALAELRQPEPEQYYYRPDELHVTVLSLWTGTPQPEPYFAQLPVYRAAIDPVLRDQRPFSIRFDGLTASPAAVLVQGYPTGPQLNDLRDRLRSAIAAAGLGHTLDGRYRISAAHMTAMRFCRPPQNLPRLLAALQSLRRCEFGQTDMAEVHLVENDWYMSHDRVRVLQRYLLYTQSILQDSQDSQDSHDA